MSIGALARYYVDLNVGVSWTTARRTITETDIVTFTSFSGDNNPLHTDAEFAKNTVFGERLLHGPAGFVIAVGLESRLGIKEGTAIAFLGMSWDMRGPIKIGDTLHVEQRVSSMRETSNPERGIVNFHVALVNQRGETVQDGEWKVMRDRRIS